MTTKELDFYTKILNDYYGEDYIETLEHLSEMLELEFDVIISVNCLKELLNVPPDIEDLILTANRCGIFY
jgi:hypothetical protein